MTTSTSSVSSIALKVAFLAFIWYFYRLPSNYLKARRTGLPLFVCPVTPDNPIWIVVLSTLQPWLVKLLPRVAYKRISPCIYGWEFRERWEMQEKLGPSFVLVSPGGMEVWTADPQVAKSILTRRKDYVQMEIARKIMSAFGNNVTSSDGEEWQRHRKIVAPVLNERIMAAVWDESRSQARQMMDHFSANGSEKVVNTQSALEGLKIIAINVMITVAYGERVSWTLDKTNGEAPAGHSMSFVEVMSLIVKFQIPISLVSSAILSSRFLPAAVRKLGSAKKEFPLYAQAMIEKERQGRQEESTLIGTLVDAVDQSTLSIGSKKHLDESEIIGNIFNITIAGFDTTANAIAYAFLCLALYPEWQDWVVEEIDGQIKPDASDYSRYAKLTRCLALLNETVRAYSPVLHITRTSSGNQTDPFPVSDGTEVFIAAACLHISPEIWGSDALEFRPTRFIETSVETSTENNVENSFESSKAPTSRSTKETLREPTKGTFMPWGFGPRQCPGQKMAQVEFVAVLVEILTKWTVDLDVREGESREEAEKELLELIQDSQPQVSQQLRNPEKVRLRFIKRQGVQLG